MLQLTFQLLTLHTWTVFKASTSTEISAPFSFLYSHQHVSCIHLFIFKRHFNSFNAYISNLKILSGLRAWPFVQQQKIFSSFTFTHSLLLSVMMLFSFSIHKLVLSSFKDSTSRFTSNLIHHLRFTATDSSTSFIALMSTKSSNQHFHLNWYVSFTQHLNLNWNFISFQLFEFLTAASVLSGFSIFESHFNYNLKCELFFYSWAFSS